MRKYTTKCGWITKLTSNHCCVISRIFHIRKTLAIYAKTHRLSLFCHFQEKYYSLKRSKPSLSIVNPLDVLRQRVSENLLCVGKHDHSIVSILQVMLEMARRQRENVNRQVNCMKMNVRNIFVGKTRQFFITDEIACRKISQVVLKYNE